MVRTPRAAAKDHEGTGHLDCHVMTCVVHTCQATGGRCPGEHLPASDFYPKIEKQSMAPMC